MKIILSLLQALLFVVSSFSVKDSNFKFWVDRAAIALSSTDEVSFDTISAGEMLVSDSEKQRCRDWFENNILTKTNPAYNFRVGLKSFRNNLDDWDISIGEESKVGEVYRGGKTSYITLTHKESSLSATVEATIYEDNATCEWTVYIKNNANENSPVISDFYAVDSVLQTGKSDLYFSNGSNPAADDFQLHKSFISSLPMRFTANGGRTESVLPYFNISSQDNGVVFCVGWSGQWYTSLRQCNDGVKIKAKQETFRGYLLPNEEIRSPLISLSFYDGNNAVKGFNTFRNWTLDCVYPDNTIGLTTAGLGNEFSTVTTETILRDIENTPKEFTDLIDAYWLDAGWYKITNTNWSDSVGTWSADPNRFPDGLAPIAEAAQERGVGLLAWYEPERCSKGTEVYEECIKHEGWLIEKNDERNMVNFANEDTFNYITDVILDSVKENKVSIFRIDSLLTPLFFWEKADDMWSDGRKGITENHYVTNFYRFLDTLLEEIPDFRIDNCCSGGKRIDIEMSRRSIPLWRSDYNCGDENGNVKEDVVEATQSFTYGLSCWLPYSGATAYVSGEYADRTNILPCAQKIEYKDIREYMNGNYYPLQYGGTSLHRIQATQYDKGNGNEGIALIYKREKVLSDVYYLKLNGLDADKTYRIYDYDKPNIIFEISGSELMDKGFKLTIPESPKAVIVIYKKI